MSKIGIISGGGKLPIIIGENFIQSGKEVIFFCIEPFAKKNNYKKYNNVFTKLESLSKVIKLLKFYNIKKIIMAGHVQRPSLKDISFDYNTVKFIKEYALQPKGDDKLLLTIVKFFEKEGFTFINWKDKCTDLFSNNDYLTNKKPNKVNIDNLKKGLDVFKKIGRADLCQSIILQNSIVLGVEAVEGTDELIKRCYKYKKKGDGGVLLKLSKFKQDNRFDLPVIGMNTVKLLKKYSYDGVFIDKKNFIIIDKRQVIDYCNSNSIFISSVLKI